MNLNSNFSKSLIASLRQIKCVGIINFNAADLSRTKCPSIPYFSTINVINSIWIIFGIMAGMNIHSSLMQFYNMKIQVTMFVHFAASISFFGILVSNMIWGLVHNKRTYNLYKKMISMDKLFAYYNVKILQTNVQRNALFFLSLEVFLTILQSWFIIRSSERPKMELMEFFCVCFRVATMYIWHFTLTYQFYIIVFSLKTLIDSLLKQLNNVDVITPDDIRVCTILHSEICDGIRLASKTLSLQILTLFGIVFLWITMQFYSAVVKLYSIGELEATYNDLSAVLLLSMKIIQFCITCQRLLNSIIRFKRVLIRMSVIKKAQSQWKLINVFYLQLLHNEDIAVSAGGFFSLDASLIFQIYSAAFTYIIILIQTDHNATGLIHDILHISLKHKFVT